MRVKGVVKANKKDIDLLLKGYIEFSETEKEMSEYGDVVVPIDFDVNIPNSEQLNMVVEGNDEGSFVEFMQKKLNYLFAHTVENFFHDTYLDGLIKQDIEDDEKRYQHSLVDRNGII
jgi:hypothetical protein